MPRRSRPQPPIVALAAGEFRLNLDSDHRGLLGRLVDQLRELIQRAPHDDARTRRLFPAAYHADAELDAEYQRYMREELVASRLAALDTVESILVTERFGTGELEAFMRSLNAVRLVLGTLLDIDDDETALDARDDDVLEPERQMYLWLSWLLEWTVDALAQQI